MNILHLYKDYPPVLGGIENTIQFLAESQAAHGHHAMVLVCSLGLRTTVEEVNGVKVIRAGRLTTAASMPISLAQPLVLARLRPDIVHIHSPYPLGEVANWLLGRSRATIIAYHSDVVRQQAWLRLYGPFLRRVLRAADRIIATSPRYIESSTWLSPVKHKCVAIPSGIDVTRFLSSSDRPPVSTPTLLFVGRLRYYKGLDTLLRALPLVANARLTVVGEGPMRQEWEALSRELGLADRVDFMGEIDDADLPAYYRRADVFVLPANARAEGFGLVLVEAMASGLPCITTELGTGTSWVVQDGATGLVVPPRDPAAMAAAVNRLVGDADLRRRFGQAGQERAQREFSYQVMAERVMQVYQLVLSCD